MPAGCQLFYRRLAEPPCRWQREGTLGADWELLWNPLSVVPHILVVIAAAPTSILCLQAIWPSAITRPDNSPLFLNGEYW